MRFTFNPLYTIMITVWKVKEMVKYHFIAIGGIGMSGLAKYLLEEGHEVSGSDIENSKYIDALKDLGAKVFIGHNSSNVPNNAIIIASTAIKENNPELVRAKELGLNIYHRSDLLKEISESAMASNKCFIGFSGTHGKTTTSGLASYVLDKAGFEPSFVDGGIVPELHTNAQHKNGKFFIAELDESDGTITKYNPDILVINNLEEDHIDYYKNGLDDLVRTFETALKKAKKVIINADNPGTALLKGNFITFGLNNADYTAKNISFTSNKTTFDVYYRDSFLISLSIMLGGIHNVYNTLAVISALNESGVNIADISKYCNTFEGMGRRFQKAGELNGIKVYDDYAHHPTEIKATLDSAAQKYGKEHIVAVFQPHRYTRLQGLWNEFKQSFDNAKRIIVTDVYAASENKIDGISGENFASDLDSAEYIGGPMEDVGKNLLPTLKAGDVVIGLGAGTITNLWKYLSKANGDLACK